MSNQTDRPPTLADWVEKPAIDVASSISAESSPQITYSSSGPEMNVSPPEETTLR